MITTTVDNGSQNFQAYNALIQRRTAMSAFVEENKEKFNSFENLKSEDKQKLLADFKTAAGITQNAQLLVNIEKDKYGNRPVSASLVDTSGNQLATIFPRDSRRVYLPEEIQAGSSIEQRFKVKIARYAAENHADIIKTTEPSFLHKTARGLADRLRDSLDRNLLKFFVAGDVNFFTTTDGRKGLRGILRNNVGDPNLPRGDFEAYIDNKGKVTSIIEPQSSNSRVDSHLKLTDFPASFRQGKAVFSYNSAIDLNKDSLLTREEIIKAKVPELAMPSYLDEGVAAKNMENLYAVFNSLPPTTQAKVLSAYQGRDVRIDLSKISTRGVEPLARQLVSDGNLSKLKELMASRPQAEEVRLRQLLAKDIVSAERRSASKLPVD